MLSKNEDCLLDDQETIITAFANTMVKRQHMTSKNQAFRSSFLKLETELEGKPGLELPKKVALMWEQHGLTILIKAECLLYPNGLALNLSNKIPMDFV